MLYTFMRRGSITISRRTACAVGLHKRYVIFYDEYCRYCGYSEDIRSGASRVSSVPSGVW